LITSVISRVVESQVCRHTVYFFSEHPLYCPDYIFGVGLVVDVPVTDELPVVRESYLRMLRLYLCVTVVDRVDRLPEFGIVFVVAVKLPVDV
jgi:hypothetical protein